ncbi:unnamed protein product [Acanthoscelides obtectus]|uniref:Fatty acid desaturase domain-containing protein n=1 Tax=Acanthoscelides obtectus TaxID=200917 RepID=A0A9P0PLI1_ACAOB|nr:unnamed protein product [Acanthoscelides obtectus]CAK1674019.1 Acyl-CoA desaturase 4 [Acanthoscelides obtectus]
MTVPKIIKTFKTSDINSENAELPEKQEFHSKNKSANKIGTDYNFKRQTIWKLVLFYGTLHVLGWYGLYRACVYCHTVTVLYSIIVGVASQIGINMGAHRLYAHRSFKAKLPLRIALVILDTIAGMYTLYYWVRDHRQHHKYTDTDADPHNSSRGFFFSHVGWLMSKKHPAVREYGKTIDVHDLESDKAVMFQKRYVELEQKLLKLKKMIIFRLRSECRQPA